MNNFSMITGIFNVCCFFLQIGALLCEALENLPKSLSLNLCLIFTAQLRNLTDNCICGVQRCGSLSQITIIAHRVSPCNLLYDFNDLLSIFLLLKLFRLGITKGLNIY